MTVELTVQNAFDIMVKGVVEQGVPAIAPDTRACMYRLSHADGALLKCAVGFLIPDEEYNADTMELEPPIEVLTRCGVTISGLNNPELVHFLNTMQATHDSVAHEAEFVRYFLYGAAGVGRALRLNVIVVIAALDMLTSQT